MTPDPRFISPVAEAFAPLPGAARLQVHDGDRVGLVDSMANPTGTWGQGMLDAAAAALAGSTASLAFERVSRPHLGAGEAAERWASVMASRYAALVIAAGD